MKKRSVLVVDDEAQVQELISYNLESQGYSVACAGTGERALELAREGKFDVVLLDLMLPNVDGLTVCRGLRNDPATQAVPIIIVSAKTEEADVVVGLKIGADDYVTKPFSPKVLIARIEAVLRRKAIDRDHLADGNSEAILVRDLTIDPGKHRVYHENRAVDLSATEFQVLLVLAEKPGWVFTRKQIIDSVHGEDYAITDRSVDVQILSIRKKLGKAGRYIETVRGVGYRLMD